MLILDMRKGLAIQTVKTTPLTRSPFALKGFGGELCMKGSIHYRADLKAGWFFVRWSDGGRVVNVNHYLDGQRMYDRRYAEKLLAQIQGDYERGVLNIDVYLFCHTDIIPFMHEWLTDMGPNFAPGTLSNYRGYVKNHLEPFFLKNHCRLHEINLQILTKLLNSLDLKPKGKQNVMHCLHSCLDYAWRSSKITAVPPFPKRSAYGLQPPVRKWITEDRQITIIEAIPAEHRPIFMFLKLHPRRPAEAMTLKWEDYDHDIDCFMIQRGLSSKKEVDYTKTKQAVTQPVHSEFKKLMEGIPRLYPFSPYVFTCRESRHRHHRYTHTIIERLWNQACAKVGENVSLYEGTKHSFCSQYLAEGYSLEQVVLLTGHANIQSLKHYAIAEVATKKALLEKKVVPLRVSSPAQSRDRKSKRHS